MNIHEKLVIKFIRKFHFNGRGRSLIAKWALLQLYIFFSFEGNQCFKMKQKSYHTLQAFTLEALL